MMQPATRAQWFLLWLFIFGIANGVLALKLLWECYSGQSTIRTGDVAVIIPWTLVYLGCTLAGAYGLWSTHRKARLANQPNPYCLRCNYDLTGLTKGACPECGWTNPDLLPRSSQPHSHRLRQRASAATDTFARIALQQASSLLHSLERGQLDAIQCPRCERESVSVSFTHPGSSYKVWFLCQSCPFTLRVQTSERPHLFTEQRVDHSLQEYDERTTPIPRTHPNIQSHPAKPPRPTHP